MPALPNVPGVVRIGLKMSYGEDIDVVNRFFVSYGGSDPTATELDTFAGVIGGDWVTNVMGNLVSTLTMESVTCTALYSSSGAEVTVPVAGSGAAGPPGVTAGAACVVSHHIARRYRGGHPRTYLAGGPVSALNDPQTWGSVFIGSIQSDFGTWTGNVVAAGWAGAGTLAFVNVSYYFGFTNHTYPSGRVRPIPTPRLTPLVDLVSGFTVNHKLGSQRRRNLQSS
jgi:hypothetical protein